VVEAVRPVSVKEVEVAVATVEVGVQVPRQR
jgi:hypothetical protein